MSAAKHTPGPWTYLVGSSEIMSSHEHDFEYRIALMNPFVAGNEANASLIAAAPELLAALKAVQMDAVGIGSKENAISDATRDLVDAAIAKTGGAA